jgi:glutaredoxin
MTEEHAHQKKPNYALYAAVIALVIAVAAVGYAATQGSEFSKRIAQNEESQKQAVAKITAFEAKLDSFEKKLDTRLADLEVALTVYYDGDCAFCDNAKLFNTLNSVESSLKDQGITLKTIDVRDDYEATLAKGIDRVPAFYASAEHLVKEPAGKYLQNLMDEWALSGFDAYNAKGGIALVPRVNSEMLTDPCLTQTATLQYFYSETCEYCKRVTNNDSVVINPATDARFKDVAGENLAKIEAAFGDTVKATQHCLNIHYRAENRVTLGVNKSDEELCVETQGAEKVGEASLLALKYHIATAPMFVVNCRYIFNAVTEDGIKKWLCAAKPSLPECKTLAPQASVFATNTP